MPFTTEIAARQKAGALARTVAWIGRRQSELSDRIHSAGEEQARRNGWTVIKDTGRFGFGTRTYRDPRFHDRRRQLSAAPSAGRGCDRAELGHERAGVKR